MATITLKTQRSFDSDIIFDHGLYLATLKKTPQDAIWFYDETLPSAFIDPLKKYVHAGTMMGIPAKEKGKSLDTLQAMLAFLDGCDVTSSTHVFALGGGALTDAVGFLASIYLRGLRLTFIPTTLLAMVDASIGGKTALNTLAKNRVGSFYPAQQILIDFDFLKTMPPPLIEDGWVEIIKIALLFDEPWVEALENQTISIEDSIINAIQHKCTVVEKDLSDQQQRKLLNLGHTIGHAIEAFYQYKYSHGICVAWGILLEHYHHHLYDRIQSLLSKYGGLKKISVPVQKLMPFLIKDKKRTGDSIDLIQLEAIGQAKIQTLTLGELEKYVISLREDTHENT